MEWLSAGLLARQVPEVPNRPSHGKCERSRWLDAWACLSEHHDMLGLAGAVEGVWATGVAGQWAISLTVDVPSVRAVRMRVVCVGKRCVVDLKMWLRFGT